MASSPLSLTDLELRYPFNPKSRGFFESIPVEDSMASAEVVEQAESRLMGALGRGGGTYAPHPTEIVEFSSFFVAALLASQDSYLSSRFSKKESEIAKGFFVQEKPGSKAMVMAECFGVKVGEADTENQTFRYFMGFDEYLALATRYELTRSQRWKLGRQALSSGRVYLTDNMLNDLFEDCARKAIEEGVKNLRKAAFPRQLGDPRARVLRYVPQQKPKPGKSYEYVEELLKHPVSDGRHRLVWMVLAPYLVNVKKADNEAAIDRIRAFVSVAGETRDMRRFVEYNVRRARRNGLMPPTLTTLRTEHPDLYRLLPKEAASEAVVRKGPRNRS